MITIQTLSRAAAIAAACTLVAIAPASAASDPTRAPAKPAAKNQRYCVETEVTGSRIARCTCKTRDAWIKSDGFDPTAK